jgi:hypothetical protein
VTALRIKYAQAEKHLLHVSTTIDIVVSKKNQVRKVNIELQQDTVLRTETRTHHPRCQDRELHRRISNKHTKQLVVIVRTKQAEEQIISGDKGLAQLAHRCSENQQERSLQEEGAACRLR